MRDTLSTQLNDGKMIKLQAYNWKQFKKMYDYQIANSKIPLLISNITSYISTKNNKRKWIIFYTKRL